MLALSVVILLSVEAGFCAQTYSCWNCTAAVVSVGNMTVQAPCLTGAPFCNNNTGCCSATPTMVCAQEDNYPCTQDGSFPHPKDCTKYRVCNNSKSRVISCKPFYAYDSSKGECVLGALCYTINCIGKSGQKAVYPGDYNYFGYCINGESVVVDRCTPGFVLNMDKQKCVPYCPAVGHKIPYISDCTKYYQCVMEPPSTEITADKVQCPRGQGFDPKLLRCVPIGALPPCAAQSKKTKDSEI